MATHWIAGLFAVILYCIVQAVRDFRAKRYAWAVVAAASAVVLATLPVPAHVVTIDLPKP